MKPAAPEFPFDVVIDPGVKIHVRHACDFTIFRDIFDEQEYKLALDATVQEFNGHPTFIVDLGMNVGYFAQYAAARLLSEEQPFVIHGFEAESENVAECRRRLAESFQQITKGSNGEIQITEGLIGEREGFGCLRLSTSHPAHRLVKAGGRPMPFCDIEKTLPRVRVDLLKCDIDGAEEAFVSNYAELIKRTKRVVIEMHSSYCDIKRTRGMLIASGLIGHEILAARENNTVEMFWRTA